MVRSGRTLRSVLRRVRRRWFLVEWSRALAWTALAGAMAIAAAGTVYGLARPGERGLMMLAGAAAAVTCGVAALVAWPLRKRPDDRQVARFIEERCPELEDRLTSAADLLRRRAASGFETLVVDEAARHAEALDLERVVSAAAVRRRGLALAAAAALLLVVAASWRDPLLRTWRAARYALFPPALTLEVQPGDARVVEGQPVKVRARVLGLPLGGVSRPLAVHVATGGAVQRIAMDPAGQAFEAEIAALEQTTTYHVESGALASRQFTLTVRRRPRVAGLELRFTYPSYTGLAPRSVEGEGDIFAPAGTRVALRVRTRAPVESGSLALAGGGRVALARLAPTLLEGQLTVSGEGAYRVSLTDPEGLTSEGETEYFIRMIDDRPPDVRIARPAGDRRVTRLEEVAFEARADDDHGVERLELVVSARGADERVIPLHRGGPATAVSGSHTLYLEDLDVRPGDFVSYYARARDVGRGKRPTEARSDIFFLEVRPFTEEFEAAQSQAFMGGGGGSFDDLTAQQKDVVIATWKLERRAGAGRSRTDIEAVARAQAEVRARAQRLVHQLDARPPGRPPRAGGDAESLAPVAPPAAMQLAVAAMSRAHAELEAADTRDAIPHEMEALNQLLRAQAEVRRRQVARQRSSAGGRGGPTGNQDLSALFDRELQRQQETNYETRSTAEPRRDAPESDPLERLRELARRQDDLSRQQRELARRRGELSPEEAKRQLERLTREQAEIQRRAEALSRELGQRGEGSTSATPGASEATAEAVREAAEEMRRAAGDLQQGQSGRAGDRGAKAIERLREAERRAAGNVPDERRRAAGDLQLELHQLAEAERSIARDASRSAGDRGTLRRLAGEQHALVPRVDGLARAARELSAGLPDADPLRRASRSLDRERIGERLQASSRELRAAAESDTAGPDLDAAEQTAATARALADALERAADGLGPATGRDAEARRLSERLGRTRELRERLEELGREIDGLRNRESGEVHGPGAARSGEGREPATGGRASTSLSRLQDEYLRRLGEAREAISQGQPDSAELARGLSTPEGWTPSRSAPGTEAFKQDFARWDALRRDVTLALERIEATLSSELSERDARTRLAADSDDRAPEAYRRQIARYYESITKKDRQ